jgi:hypothetical protein
MADFKFENESQPTCNGSADTAEWPNEHGYEEEDEDEKYRHLNVPLTPQEISEVVADVAARWADFPF